MADAYLAYFFQTLGMALIACAVCWVCLPKGDIQPAEKRLLFFKLLGAFMTLHFCALVLTAGGANVVLTAFASYALVRWCWMPKRQ